MGESIPAEVVDQLRKFNETLSVVEDALQPHLNESADTYLQMRLLDRARVDVMSLFAINSLYWILLCTRGKNPKENESLNHELTRAKQCIERLKQFESRSSAPKLNRRAAASFVRNALWEPPQQTSKMRLLDRARVDVMSLFAINSLYWILLCTRGKNPKENESLNHELTRAKQCIERLKQFESRSSAPKLNRRAAASFVRNALWEPPQQTSKDEENTIVEEPLNTSAESSSSTVLAHKRFLNESEQSIECGVEAKKMAARSIDRRKTAVNNECIGVVHKISAEGIVFIFAPGYNPDPYIDQRLVPPEKRYALGDFVSFTPGEGNMARLDKKADPVLRVEVDGDRVLIETQIAFFPAEGRYANCEEALAGTAAWSPEFDVVLCEGNIISHPMRSHMYTAWVERYNGQLSLMGQHISWQVSNKKAPSEPIDQKQIMNAPWNRNRHRSTSRRHYRLRPPAEVLKHFTKDNYEGIVVRTIEDQAIVWSAAISISEVLFLFGARDGMIVGDWLQFNCEVAVRVQHNCFLEGKKYELIPPVVPVYQLNDTVAAELALQVPDSSEGVVRHRRDVVTVQSPILGPIEFPPGVFEDSFYGQTLNIRAIKIPKVSSAHAVWRFDEFITNKRRCGDGGEIVGVVVDSNNEFVTVWISELGDVIWRSRSSFQLNRSFTPVVGRWILFRSYSVGRGRDTTESTIIDGVAEPIAPKLPTRLIEGQVQIQTKVTAVEHCIDGTEAAYSKDVGRVTVSAGVVLMDSRSRYDFRDVFLVWLAHFISQPTWKVVEVIKKCDADQALLTEAAAATVEERSSDDDSWSKCEEMFGDMIVANELSAPASPPMPVPAFASRFSRPPSSNVRQASGHSIEPTILQTQLSSSRTIGCQQPQSSRQFYARSPEYTRSVEQDAPQAVLNGFQRMTVTECEGSRREIKANQHRSQGFTADSAEGYVDRETPSAGAFVPAQPRRGFQQRSQRTSAMDTASRCEARSSQPPRDQSPPSRVVLTEENDPLGPPIFGAVRPIPILSLLSPPLEEPQHNEENSQREPRGSDEDVASTPSLEDCTKRLWKNTRLRPFTSIYCFSWTNTVGMSMTIVPIFRDVPSGESAMYAVQQMATESRFRDRFSQLQSQQHYPQGFRSSASSSSTGYFSVPSHPPVQSSEPAFAQPVSSMESAMYAVQQMATESRFRDRFSQLQSQQHYPQGFRSSASSSSTGYFSVPSHPPVQSSEPAFAQPVSSMGSSSIPTDTAVV
ncbi:Nuclear nucleic acid-binding protein C1D [Toxocara canis]|uniref:Nuclear nucleic acid-binding protein C1D n=1 Tax=Toxocara canis TaxID=6265 RepID=A0A0B2VZE3_TOXCA|nr:Nuclear nucleic acid-binding protein C1D [Toxocara canis]